MSRKSIDNYEAMVILNPSMVEEESTALIERLGAILTEGGAEIKETSLWGKRKLAYSIAHQSEGYYVIFFFTLTEVGEVLDQFERTCRFDENILRFMIVKVPTKKRGQEVAQLVPAPGYLADFRVEPRGMGRMRGGGGRRGAPPMSDRDRPPTQPAGDAPGESPEPVDASSAPEVEVSATPVESPAPVEASAPPEPKADATEPEPS